MQQAQFPRTTLALSIVLLLWCQAALCQDTTNTIGNVSIASPTAAALGKYGDIPVSYNTGIPNISIPFFTAEAGSLKLPIGLSYHASGLKVQENASWVGAGWALNAGGVITRTVVGAPDDRGVQAANVTTNGYYSDSGYNSYLFIKGAGNPTQAYDGYYADDITFCQGFKDGEPDLYFFNFGGYTGKFYFNDDQTPVLVPEEDFKIQPDLNNGVGGLGFQGFVITTPDGVKYYFGKTGNTNTAVVPIELTSATTIQNNYLAANQAVSSWFLNKIVSPDGIDSITLNYQQESYSYYTISMSPTTNLENTGSAPSALTGFNLVKNFVQGVRLSQVNFPNGSITLRPSASPRTDLTAGYATNTGMYDAANTGTYPSYALGSITITNNNGFCKKDSLYYGYFYDANPTTLNPSTYGSYNIHSDAYRLRLDSIQETSCDGTASQPPYKFTYFSELVPRKLSFGMDHWGFSNGVTNNQGLIPTYSNVTATGSIVQTYPGASRDAAWPAMRGGALQQITYPTGGSTSFTFQANDTYGNATNYVSTLRASMSCGYDGHNGSLGDGGDNPDTTHFTGTGNTFQFVLSNSSQGGSGQLEIFNVGSNTLAYNVGSASPGQTDTFYMVIAPGNYWLELTKSPALSGYGISATINENVPVTTSGNFMVGGLRLQTITHNDGITPNSIVTNYTYTTGGTQSSGILYSRPVYVQSIRNDLYGWIYQPITGTQGCITTAATYYISPTSISPMQTIQGNHIGYNQVQVSQTGNGYSIYRYYGSNYWDNIIGDVCTRVINTGQSCTAANIPNFPASPLPFDPMRGELKYEGHFNQSGQVLKETTYTPVYVFDSLTTPACKYINIPGLYSLTPYSLQSAKKAQTATVSTLYNPVAAGSVTTTSTVYYGSNYHHQATRQVTSTSTGDSLASNTLYAFDFRIASCDAIPDSLPYLITSSNSDTTAFFAHLGVCSPSGWLCRSDTLQNLRRHINLLRAQFERYRRRSFFGPGSLQSSCHITNEAAADTLLKPVLRLQDEYANAPIEVSKWRDNSLLQASFTKYDTSLSPVGFAYPGRSQLINLQAPSGSFTKASVSGSTIAKDSRYLNETLYSFSNGNPLQVTPHSGVVTSYIWDYLHTQPIAKVTNAASNQIAYTSFEADGSGNWQVPSTARDTGSITGSKCYNLTNGNITFAGLSSATSYVVSFWLKPGSASVAGSTASVQGKTIKGWTYYEYKVSGITTATVSGSGDIDELRLYPASAQMTTYTFNPLVGMTSQCDADNRVTYYEYDALARLVDVRDQDLNVVKRYCYNYSGHTTNCQILPPQPVVMSNSTTTSMTVLFTSQNTEAQFSFTCNAGASNVTLGSIPQDTYNVGITPTTTSNIYPIIFTCGGSTQTYISTVAFNGITVSSSLTLSTSPVPLVAVNSTDQINQNFTEVLTNSYGGAFTFNLVPGNVVTNYVPAGTYNVGMTPGSPVNTYPILFTCGSSTQTYFSTVGFNGIAITSPVSMSAYPLPQIPVNSADEINQNVQEVLTNSYGGQFTFNLVPGNVVTNYVPAGTYGVLMSNGSPTASYQIDFTANGNSQYYYGPVGFSGVDGSSQIHLTSYPAPTFAVMASNNTTKPATIQFTNSVSGYAYSFTVAVGASNVQVGTLPEATYNVLMTPNPSNSSQPILWEIYSSSQTYYGPVGFSNITVSSTCPVNIIREY